MYQEPLGMQREKGLEKVQADENELNSANLVLELKKQKHINQVYKNLREINRLLLTEQNREVFINEICRILSGEQGYKSVRIVLLKEDRSFDIAAGNASDDEFETLTSEMSKGIFPYCVVCALKQDGVSVITDREGGCPNCTISGETGECCVMSVRISDRDQLFGVLTVSIPAEYEDEVEVNIFGMVASDIGMIFGHFLDMGTTLRFRNIIETLPQTFSMISSDYRYLVLNSAYSEIFGIPSDNMVSRKVSDFFPANLWENLIKPKLDQALKGNTAVFEVDGGFRGMGERWMRMHYYPYRAESGEITGIISHGIEITEQKKIEDQLINSERRYRYLVETATDTISILSVDGYFQDINSSILKLTGRSRDELIGKPIDSLDPNFSPERFRLFWADIPVGENLTFETIHRRKDGSEYPVEISARKIMLNGKKQILSVARDITERKHDREQLLEAVRRAEESDRLKSAFLANMSHEIRTPLNGILGFSSLLSEPDISPDSQQKYYSMIKQSGNRLLTTINDLIDISKIEAGMVETEKSAVDINELLDELYSFFKPELSMKGVEFVLEKNCRGDCASVETDRGKLYGILMNLLKNAVKFTERGSITLGCNCTSDEVKFYVKDTGIGIPADKIDTVFERFMQADQSLTKSYEGSGLGLSICREYSALISGKITVESEYGKGSVFSLLIDRKQGA